MSKQFITIGKFSINKNLITNVCISKRIFYMKYPYYVKIEMRNPFTEPNYKFSCENEKEANNVYEEFIKKLDNN
jgi:hypothetical protein